MKIFLANENIFYRMKIYFYRMKYILSNENIFYRMKIFQHRIVLLFGNHSYLVFGIKKLDTDHPYQFDDVCG